MPRRRCSLLSWLLLAACADPSKPSDAAETGEAEAFPCRDIPGAPTFQRVHGALDGYVLVPWYDPAGEEAGVVVLDSDGCTRWSHEVPPFVTAARWRDDEVWYNKMGGDPALHHVDMSTGEAGLIETPTGHHDFVLHADGTIAWLAEDEREIDGVDIRGDVVREMAPDGVVTDVWNAFDDMDIRQHDQWDLQTPHDWTHANGLAFVPETQGYIVSLYWLKEIADIDRASGRSRRHLRGDELGFGPQHAPSGRVGGGVRVFDNSRPTGTSRFLELDWEGQVAWEWTPADELQSLVLGDVHMREDGVILGSFGAEGVLVAVRDGEEIWRASAPNVVLGRLDWRAELPG